MIEALLGLPAHLRRRLASALESGLLAMPSRRPPLSILGMRDGREGVVGALLELKRLGISGPAAAAWIRTVDEATSPTPRPDLVWSGPEVPGLHARDTRRVFEELLGSAERSVWASTYAFFDGPRAFEDARASYGCAGRAPCHAVAEHPAEEGRHDRGGTFRAEVCGSFLDCGLAGIVAPPRVLRPARDSSWRGRLASFTPRPWWPTTRRSLSPPRISPRPPSTATSSLGSLFATARSRQASRSHFQFLIDRGLLPTTSGHVSPCGLRSASTSGFFPRDHSSPSSAWGSG